MSETLIKILISSLLVTALVAVGLVVNILLPWQHLVDFFAVLRYYAQPYDFFWNTELTFQLVGYSFFIEASLWVLYTLISIVKLAGWNK
jgi:uncharacterized membrane protein